MLSHLSSLSPHRRPVGMALLVATLMLAGCASRGEPQTYGWQAQTQASIKDDAWAPVVKPVVKPVAKKPAPTVVKTAPIPERPRAPEPEPPRPPARPEPPRGPLALPAGCGTDANCLAQLKALIHDPQRAWVGKPQPPAEYAQGIRLFAYRALRNKLACSELKSALAEIETASRSLQIATSGVTPEQAARARLLGAQVQGELRSEQARRCTS